MQEVKYSQHLHCSSLAGIILRLYVRTTQVRARPPFSLRQFLREVQCTRKATINLSPMWSVPITVLHDFIVKRYADDLFSQRPEMLLVTLCHSFGSRTYRRHFSTPRNIHEINVNSWSCRNTHNHGKGTLNALPNIRLPTITHPLTLVVEQAVAIALRNWHSSKLYGNEQEEI